MTATQAKHMTLRRLLPRVTFFSDVENLHGDYDDQVRFASRMDDLRESLGLGNEQRTATRKRLAANLKLRFEQRRHAK